MIDQKTISTYFGDDDSLLRKFVAVFVRESPLLINLMDEALASGDRNALALHAHTLKSQIKYFGYPELVQQLQEIEHMAEQPAPTPLLPGLLSEFNRDFRGAYEALAAIVL
jgi:HPt (histidine-containing phosphotransfer) domain-containing protein